MSSDDKLNALFEQAVAGQERLSKEAEPEAEVTIEEESESSPEMDGDEVFSPEELALEDEIAADAASDLEPDTSPEPPVEKKAKTASEVVTEALIKAKQEALEALEQTQKEAKDMHNQLLRKTADFDNFRKRSRKQQEDAVRFALEDVLREFLPVVDNFERALEHVGDKADDPVVQGVSMVKQQLDATMSKLGVSPIEAVGQAFDPKFHEAVERQETDDVPAGAIFREYQKGYMLKENLLRPAMVVVAVGKPKNEQKIENSSDPTAEDKQDAASAELSEKAES